MMHNNIFLNRMIIYTREGAVAYDEKFHKGVNIIRGDNSSGKSTITHFMFYVLGGAFNDWVKEAKECSVVFAEVNINGATLTLKREINLNNGKGNKIEALYIFWGEIEDALNDARSWKKFNFNTTSNQKSYSNVLFETLDLPIVQGENNITFHQILRLLYIDQESPTNSLFYYEKFDSHITRETVADLLLGIYNQDLYDFKQEKIHKEKEFNEIKKEISIIKKFTSSPLNLDTTKVLTKIEKKEHELIGNELAIQNLRKQSKKVKYTTNTKLEFQKISESVSKQRESISDLSKDIKILSLEILDTNQFIDALKNKVEGIQKSIVTRDFLGRFPLQNCPECLSELEVVETPNTCKLCKQEIDNSFGITQARKIEQELSFQINESTKIVKKNKKDLSTLSITLEVEKKKYTQVQKSLNNSIDDVRSVRDEQIDELLKKKGFIEGEIIQLNKTLENALTYQALLDKRDSLKEKTILLTAQINKLTREQDILKVDINQAIERKGVYLLNNDLRRQKDFFQAKEFHIDYRNNIAFISDKEAKYSASSSFYLKTSARFSIFLASLKNSKMRYPRFIFCDNMEDKGIEAERAKNFQRILIKETEKYDSDSFQLIYTTSFIPEELNNTVYCVGEEYSETNPSLKYVD